MPTLGANVDAIEPMRKSMIPRMNIAVEPSLSDNCPPSNVNAAVVIEYPERIQDKVALLDPKCCSISGNAMVVPVNAAGRRIIAMTAVTRTNHFELLFVVSIISLATNAGLERTE